MSLKTGCGRKALGYVLPPVTSVGHDGTAFRVVNLDSHCIGRAIEYLAFLELEYAQAGWRALAVILEILSCTVPIQLHHTNLYITYTKHIGSSKTKVLSAGRVHEGSRLVPYPGLIQF